MVILDDFEPVAGRSKSIDFNEPVAGPSTAYEHVTDVLSIVFRLMAEPIGAAEHTVNSEVDLSNKFPETSFNKDSWP